MGIVLDFILIAILIINVIIGYKKGLINVAINILAFLIAIIVTLFLFRPIANIVIENTEIDEKIKDAIIINMSNSKNDISAENKETVDENNQNEKKEIGEDNKKLQIVNNMQNLINEKIKEEADSAKQQTLEVVAQNIALRATEILTAIALFIILRICLVLLRFVAESLSELPIIKQLDKSGGIVYGILKSAVIILLLLTIFYFVVTIRPNGLISSSIEESFITKFLYENNIVIKLVLKFL